MKIKMKRFYPTLLIALLLTACGSKPSQETSNASVAEDTTKTEATVNTNDSAKSANDSDVAEIVKDGKVSYRPDSLRVLHEKGFNKDSTFVVISKKELRLKVYGKIKGDTTLLAQYPVCLSRNKGQKEKSGDMRTPESTMEKPFHIKQIQDASTWHHDFGDGRGEILSYGHWFLRLETPFNGIGIHGSTNNEDKMPGRDSEGCIRLRDNDLDHFKSTYAYVGMPIIIKGENEGNLSFENKIAKK